jgi:multiple sugar transport system permease protein
MAAVSATTRRGFLASARQSIAVQNFVRRGITYIILTFAAVLFLTPLFWMISTSFKTPEKIFLFPPQLVPDPFTLRGYERVLSSPSFPFFLYLRNSLFYAVLSVIGIVLSCSLVGYSFACLRWPGRDAIFIVTLATMMIPFPVVMVPLYIVFKFLGVLNTYWPLIGPNFLGTAFFIFLMRQFFKTIPLDLTEAARVDGASYGAIYARIMMPLARPVVATTALFTFLYCWNDFLGPLIFLSDDKKYPLALGLALLRGQHRSEWDMMMAGSTIVSLPIIVLFFFTQKTFIQGITLTGIKG